jgi:FKBP-type peptidyl-prolyl cis-trans isomerase 2
MKERLSSRLFAALSILALAPSGSALAETAQTSEKENVVIEEGRTVSIEYTLKLDDGSVADTNVGGEPLVYTQGNGQILPALEKNLEGMAADETRSVQLTATDGYGEVNEELYREVPPDQIPEEAREVGQVLYGQGPNGQPFQVRVYEVREEAIVLDLNHPLAGQALNFDIRIISVE